MSNTLELVVGIIILACVIDSRYVGNEFNNDVETIDRHKAEHEGIFSENNIPSYYPDDEQNYNMLDTKLQQQQQQQQLESLYFNEEKNEDEAPDRSPNTGLPPFATKKINIQCANKVSHEKCSTEFLARGSCISNLEFDFHENCQQYCEFCVNVPSSRDNKSDQNSQVGNLNPKKFIPSLDSEKQEEETSTSDSSEKAPTSEERKQSVKTTPLPSATSCVNKASYLKCSIEFLIRQSCDYEANKSGGFDFFENCQQYCEFCVVNLSDA